MKRHSRASHVSIFRDPLQASRSSYCLSGTLIEMRGDIDVEDCTDSNMESLDHW